MWGFDCVEATQPVINPPMIALTAKASFVFITLSGVEFGILSNLKFTLEFRRKFCGEVRKMKL
jgi:hypothetical protein